MRLSQINYALDRGDALNLYLEHERLEIDNNLIENAIRPTAIGKKNFLFFGSADSGQTSAIIYSLTETYRKLDINPKLPAGRLHAGSQTAKSNLISPSRGLSKRHIRYRPLSADRG